MTLQDNSHILQEQVEQAFSSHTPLLVCGNSSKSFYGFLGTGKRLETTTHTGITSYDPAELVLTARAGTPLSEIETALSQEGQMLGCEAPDFGGATFGGMIAAGLSGPRRPWGGSIADLVLGCTLINGRGEVLRFGGRVMKNVAGYDISRLLTGSLGCLGVILEATVKVVPRPDAERSFRFTLKKNKTARFIAKLGSLGYPVSAACHDGNLLYVRFSASATEVHTLHDKLQQHFGFLDFEEELLAAFWEELKEQKPAFFHAPNLWRISLPAASAELDLPGTVLYEWGGALRWLSTTAGPAEVFAAVSAAEGSACLFRCDNPAGAQSLFQPLPPALYDWHKRLKAAFDPAGILNPGRMYREL